VIDLGDPVVLTFLVKDAAGVLVDAGAAVCTVTLPDASTSTPAVVHTGTGTYTATFTTTQAGRHGVRWVATGANAQTYTDVFQVADSIPGMLISLDEARRGLTLPGTATAKDDDLRSLILECTPIIEDLCGPILPAAKDEWYDGGARTVRLLQAPIISVTAVQESYGNYTRTLTEQALSGSSFDAYGYTVDKVDGILQRRISGREGIFQSGRRNIHVTYTAGRSVMPANLVLATRRLVRHLWQQEQQGYRPDFGSPEGAMVSTPSGFLVPHVVVEACGAEARIIGIA
jgi:hypothetical protein